MKSKYASILLPGLSLPPILHELSAVAAAIISRNGTLEEANPGFLRILPNIVEAGAPQDVRGSFVNPRFDQFAAKGGNSADGAVYRGVVNIGNTVGVVRSLRGAIYALGEKLLIVVEPDIAEIEKSLAALESLNAQFFSERRETVEVKVPHSGRSSGKRTSFARPNASAPSSAPKAPSGQNTIDPTSCTTSRVQIPVDVAIALLRMGRSSKIR